MQTSFHNGVNPWAGLHVPSTRKEAKEQRLKGWTKPPRAEDKLPTRSKGGAPRKIANQPKGDRVGTSKLKAADVLQILELLDQAEQIKQQLADYSPQSIAAKFGVAESTIYAIRQGIAWSSVTGITKGGKQ